MGDADRTIRLLIAAPTGVFFFSHRLVGAAEVVLGVIVVYLLATAVLGWCAVYALMRISTTSSKDSAVAKR